MNRRTFLAASAVGMASMNAFGAPSNRVRVGLMGAGGRGKELSKVYSGIPGVEISVIADVDENRAKDVAGLVEKAAGKAPRTETDFRKILDDKNVDVFVCAAPNHWHAPATILATKAGKHVYVEKPCSHNPREGEIMVEVAAKHNRLVQMGNQRRTWPKIREAMESIQKGEIGEVHLAQSWYLNNRASIGKGIEKPVPAELNFDLWQGPAPRKPYKDNYLHYNWHWFWHWGNGELGNNGIHMIDICRWGLGVEYPTSVYSSGGRYHFQDDQETPDTNTVEFNFQGGKHLQWFGLSCNRSPIEKHPDIVFTGTKGSLVIRGGAYFVHDLKGKELRKDTGDAGINEHVTNFIQAVRGDAKLNSPIAEGTKSTLLCHLGNIAYRTGQMIKCDASNGKILNDPAAMKMWSREYQPGWEPTVS
jgi:predicted dehydrogenase